MHRSNGIKVRSNGATDLYTVHNVFAASQPPASSGWHSHPGPVFVTPGRPSSSGDATTWSWPATRPGHGRDHHHPAGAPRSPQPDRPAGPLQPGLTTPKRGVDPSGRPLFDCLSGDGEIELKAPRVPPWRRAVVRGECRRT